MAQHPLVDLDKGGVIDVEPVKIAVETQRDRTGLGGGQRFHCRQRQPIAIQSADHVQGIRHSFRCGRQRGRAMAIAQRTASTGLLAHADCPSARGTPRQRRTISGSRNPVVQISKP
jgi:hypothetical protein